jgi:hypothetical protein
LESLDKVRNFAGDDIATAVVEPAVRAVLADYDAMITYYTVTVEAHA